MPKAKRKWSSVDTEGDNQQICIIHMNSASPGIFTHIKSLPDPDAKFQKLCEIRDKRMSAASSFKERMASTCELIPDVLEDYHGYHRSCYQRFTMHLDRILPDVSQTQDIDDEHTYKLSPRKRSGDHILFSKDCIFCNQDDRINVKSKGVWTRQSTSVFEFNGWHTIADIAKHRNDVRLLRRINGRDLFACEARYHPACRKRYTDDGEHWKSKNEDSITEQVGLEEAHAKAFDTVAEYVSDKIISNHEVIQLSELRHLYVNELMNTDYENPSYRSEKLKRKLQNDRDIGPQIDFTLVAPNDNSFLPFYLVINKKMTVSEALNQSYHIGSKDNIKDVAMILRRSILQGFDSCTQAEMKWPPDIQNLEVNESVIPPLLKRFLSLLINETESSNSSRASRIIYSIGQDLCRGVTNGEWKLPKHIILCVTLRHLYRSKQLITLLNRLGHCENNSFALEIESAIASSLDAKSTLLTDKIVKGPDNVIFHSEWDNFNQFLSGHGQPMCNAAGGIMMQEISDVNHDTTEPVPFSSSHYRSQTVLPEFHVTKKGPAMNVQVKTEPAENISSYKTAMQKYLIWTICRNMSSSDKQQVPAFGGFISETGNPPNKLTTIDYYPMINEPITTYKVVKEILQRSSQATAEVGQRYTIITFDLGVIMKAMPIIWNSPDEYRDHIILIGAFHAIMNYLKMIGHKMAGSGYSEIIMEANLVTSGCLNGVMSGKSFAKSLRCLKAVSECFERYLLDAFVEQLPDDSHLRNISAMKIDVLIQKRSSNNLMETQYDRATKLFVESYEHFQQKVRQGHLGKTAEFWLSFLDHARRVFQLIFACKTNNYPLFHKCMADMADLFFSYGGHNYARFLSWFDVYLKTIEATHPGATELLTKGAISVARSQIPGNLCMVDKTMEETFMKFAKSRGGAGGAGITGLLTNYDAYQRWIRTTAERSKYYESTLEMCGLTNENDDSKAKVHHETRPSEINRSEVLVQRAMAAVNGFINPFHIIDKNRLYILSSGCPVSPDIERDVLGAEKAGFKCRERFVKERLHENTKGFYDVVTKLKLLTMEKVNKKIKLTSSAGKAIQYREQGDIAFQLLIKSQLCDIPISIVELMTYCITPVPHSLGTADGFLAKTDKSKLLAYLTTDVPSVNVNKDDKLLHIEDGNARLYVLKNLPATFEQISVNLLEQLPRDSDILFSTDMYYPRSVKSQERLRRGTSEKLIIEGVKTRRPADFKAFLQNEDNKLQLFKIIKQVWSSKVAAHCLKHRNVMMVVEGSVFNLTSPDGLSTQVDEKVELKSNQEETDTRVILYIDYAQRQGYDGVVVRSPDSDLMFILLYYAQTFEITILLDTSRSDKRRLLNITEMANDLGHQYCESLLGLYVFTGEDANSAFKGKGKVTPLKTLLKKPRYIESFTRLGNNWQVDDMLFNELEEFTCLLYGHPRLKSVDAVRAVMLKQMVGDNNEITTSSKVDLSRLPPCKRSLRPHIKRVNYRVGQWKYSHMNFPELPPATDHGWKDESSYMEPVWSDGPVLPAQLIDILATEEEETSRDDTSDVEEIDVELSSEEDSDAD